MKMYQGASQIGLSSGSDRVKQEGGGMRILTDKIGYGMKIF